jgi:hypothetical protein
MELISDKGEVSHIDVTNLGYIETLCSRVKYIEPIIFFVIHYEGDKDMALL